MYNFSENNIYTAFLPMNITITIFLAELQFIENPRVNQPTRFVTTCSFHPQE